MIGIDGLRCEAGDFRLEVSLDIRDGEYFVLFGTTGCGKTSLLECLCGLRPVSAGRVTIAGVDVTHAEPRARRIGYVPQDGALFSHLTVRENLLFALTVRGAGASEKERVVHHLAGQLGVEKLLNRTIAGLSGGERQRVALGRALVGDPQALLLDEPVSALDECTRDAVCREIVHLQRQAGIPVLHVCHLFEEARLVADRMAIMRNGRIVQVGTPDELVTAPRDEYVARILRLENVFFGAGIRRNGTAGIKVADLVIPCDVREEAVRFIVHPWDVTPCSGIQDPSVVVVEGVIQECARVGAVVRVRIGGPLPLTAHIPRGSFETSALRVGAPLRLCFAPSAVYILGLGRDS